MLNYLNHFIYQILNPFLLFLLNALMWRKKKKLEYFNVFLIIIIQDFIIIKNIIFIKQNYHKLKMHVIIINLIDSELFNWQILINLFPFY